MARVNKCKLCGNTEPPSGWAGANHSLCNDCIPLRKLQKATNEFAMRFARLSPEQQAIIQTELGRRAVELDAANKALETPEAAE